MNDKRKEFVYPENLKSSKIVPYMKIQDWVYQLPNGYLETTKKERKKGDTSILLYMPSTFSESVGADWGSEDIVNIGDGGVLASFMSSARNTLANNISKKVIRSVEGNMGATTFPTDLLIYQKPNPLSLDLALDFFLEEALIAGLSTPPLGGVWFLSLLTYPLA